MKVAGIGANDLPAAFAEDGPSREAICPNCLHKGPGPLSSTILEGKKDIGEPEFLQSIDHQYVVLYSLQLAIQAALVLAAHLIADEGWEAPERSGEAFLTLGEKGVLAPELSRRLRTMASFRNLIVHEYETASVF